MLKHDVGGATCNWSELLQSTIVSCKKIIVI